MVWHSQKVTFLPLNFRENLCRIHFGFKSPVVALSFDVELCPFILFRSSFMCTMNLITLATVKCCKKPMLFLCFSHLFRLVAQKLYQKWRNANGQVNDTRFAVWKFARVRLGQKQKQTAIVMGCRINNEKGIKNVRQLNGQQSDGRGKAKMENALEWAMSTTTTTTAVGWMVSNDEKRHQCRK